MFPLGVVGHDLALHEASNAFAEYLVLFLEEGAFYHFLSPPERQSCLPF